MEEEIWVKVPGSEKYEVSDRGNVRSLDFRRTGQVRLMKPGKDRERERKVAQSPQARL